MLVVMTGLAGIGPVTTRVAVSYAAAGAVLVLLAGASLVLTRAILRLLGERSRWLSAMTFAPVHSRSTFVRSSPRLTLSRAKVEFRTSASASRPSRR